MVIVWPATSSSALIAVCVVVGSVLANVGVVSEANWMLNVCSAWSAEVLSASLSAAMYLIV